ncbi:MAG: TonB-dependent receptor [Pseudomonadota bacterium]
MKYRGYVLKASVAAVLAVLGGYAGAAENTTLEEVVVTSTTIDDRFEAKRGEPSSVGVISGQKVDERHGKNIIDVLNSIPGVTAELQSGDSVKIMLRGVEAQRYMGEKPGVAVVIDGVPVTERTGRINIDLDNVDSIKVIKGGASYLYGEDALSGAVVITTKRGAKMAGVTVSGEAGSFEYNKKLIRAGFASGSWVGHVQATEARAKDFYYQGGYSRNYFNGKLQYLISESSDLTFGFEQGKRNKDSHGSVTGVTAAYTDPRSYQGKDYARHYDVGLDKMFLTWANDLGTMGNLLMNTYQYADHTRFWSGSVGYLRVPSRRPGRWSFQGGNVNTASLSNYVDAYTADNDQNQKQRGFKTEWRREGEVAAFMAGVDVRRDTDRQKIVAMQTYSMSPAPLARTASVVQAGTMTSDFQGRVNTNALYGEGKLKLAEPLTLTMNARRDNVRVGYDDYLNNLNLGKGFQVWSERAGLNYALTDKLDLFGNLSNGFRIPTIQQLYAGTITPTGVVKSNPNLRPERAWNQEVGLRSKEPFGLPVSMEMAAFQVDRKNFILNVGGQYSAINATPLNDQYQNIGGVRNRGLELSLKSDAKQMLSADVAYTYLDAKFTQYDSFYLQTGRRGAYTYTKYNNTGHVVPRTPRHNLFLTGRMKPLDGLTLTAELNAQSGIYADELNWIRWGGRTVTNLMASYDIKTSSYEKVSFFARVDNLFNRFYFNTMRASSDANGDGVFNAQDASLTVNPGRVMSAGLAITF